MNTFWLVWCHYGVYHIIVLGCVSVKLSMDLLLKRNMGKEWCFTAKNVQFGLITQMPALFFLRLFFYCFLEVWGLLGSIIYKRIYASTKNPDFYSPPSFKSGSLLQTSCHSLWLSLYLSLSAGMGPERWWTVTDWLGPMLAVAPRGN